MVPIVEGRLGTVGTDEVVVSVIGIIAAAAAAGDTTGVDAAAPLFTSQGFGGDGIIQIIKEI
jgi:hypothetical protein